MEDSYPPTWTSADRLPGRYLSAHREISLTADSGEYLHSEITNHIREATQIVNIGLREPMS